MATSSSRKVSGSPLLGFTSLSGEDKKYRRNKKQWKVIGVVNKFNYETLKELGVFKFLKVSIVIAILGVILFFYKYQVHVEIQAFKRGWIRDTILPTPPLSSQCFKESTILASAYNTTLVKSPKYVEIHSGIGMPLGDDCYNFASTIPKSPIKGMEIPQELILHTYWRADLLPLGSRQVQLIHSILSNQDKATTRLILWTNSESKPPLVESKHLLNPIEELYGSRFIIKTIDKVALARGTPMENNNLLSVADSKAWLDGDIVRILVLWNLGGIWIDMDTIMTGRDLRMLAEHEWVTQWDCYDKIFQPMNGAMMHFFKESPYLCEMLYAMANDPPPRQGTTDWGSLLYHKVWRRLLDNSIKPFKILPYCFTDGFSCKLDNRLPDPFGPKDWSWGIGKMESLEVKIRSVWAVHLHNRWELSLPTDGWVAHLILSKVDESVERYTTDRIKEKIVGKLDPI